VHELIFSLIVGLFLCTQYTACDCAYIKT